jgi:hypothetical protein
MDSRASGTVAPERATPAVSAGWRLYLATFVATGAALLTMYLCLLTGLDRTGNLPPPAIVNSICTDEKIEWLRDHMPKQPNLLVVGSSVAWRNIDSAEIIRRNPAIRPFNGASCGLKANQTEFLTNYLLARFPSVQTVVMVAVPQDFDKCETMPTQFFDPAAVDAYAFERQWKYGFYLRYFDLVSLFRNATLIQGYRSGRLPFDTLIMTRFGDAPLYTDKDRGAYYGPFEGYDQSCFAALHRLAQTVTAGGRSLVVATGALDPDWVTRYDPDGRIGRELVSGVRAAVEGTGAQVWDGDRAFDGSRSEFVDAIHLKWSAAHRYTTLLSAALATGQGWD